MSPDVGHLDEEALAALLEEDPDAAAELLAGVARATDPRLRALARLAAARLLVPPARRGGPDRVGGASRVRHDAARGMDLDLDATIGRLAEAPGAAVPPRWQDWGRPARAHVLLVDASGSVAGRPLTTAVVTAAALASRLRSDDELAVVAFWSRSVVLRHVRSAEAPAVVLDRLFDLRGGDTTDLAAGLRAALGQAALARAARREVLVLTDGLANEGDPPAPVAATAAAAGARVHVLGVAATDEAEAACRDLAGAGGGRYAPLRSPSGAAAAVAEVLGG